MRLIEDQVRQEYFNIRVSRDELLTLVSIGGYVGGSSPARNVFMGLSNDAARVLALDAADCYRTAAGKLAINVRGTLYLDNSEEPLVPLNL